MFSASPWCLLAALKAHDGFEVIGLREEVESFGVVNLIIAIGKKGQVAAKRLRIAGDIDDAFRSPFHNPVHHLRTCP